MKRELQYTRANLNRADCLRSDADVDEMWCTQDCRILPLHNNKSLFASDLEPIVANHAELESSKLQLANKSFLGIDADNLSYFSVCCDDTDADRWRSLYPGAEFHDLRAVGGTLDPDIASVLVYARGLSHWQSVSNYCSRCGGKNQGESAGHSMRCQKCSAQVFPRTDPAVIMLVERQDKQGIKKCLLGRSPAWPAGCYSTLAGFVETGETLEAAVIREVHEEAGIVVENPLYVASQPWPFPQSIMLGFVATAVNADIILDKQELANAGWFSAEELSGFGEWADQGDGYKLPRSDSIARHLIDSWIAKQP